MEDFMDYTLNLDNSEIYLLMRRLGYNDDEIVELRKTLEFKKELGPTARREIKINPFYRVLPEIYLSLKFNISSFLIGSSKELAIK